MSERYAWEDFYGIYWGPILGYARKLGLNDADANDVLQETMVALMEILPRFQYDRAKGKFRNFLLTIVHRKCLAAFRRKERRQEIVLEEMNEPSVEAAQPGEGPDESVWREAMMYEALRRLEADPRIRRETLEAFRAYVVEGKPAAEVATAFGIKENALYQIRSRILARLREEVETLVQMAAMDERD